ncbi:MAG: dihydroorotate dehydrogenase [Planctomycetota bacterium]
MLAVDLGSIRLKNPLLTASGTFGGSDEMAAFFDLSRLGGIVLKTVTFHPRRGNRPPRVAETPLGMLNSIGLPNGGLDYFIEKQLPVLRQIDTFRVVNVAGDTVDQFIEGVRRLDEAGGMDAFELNISCPNVEGGRLPFGSVPDVTERLVKGVREVTERTVIVKLSPNVTDITEIARAATAGGADVLSLINTLLGMGIDVRTRRPKLGSNFGGLSGPAIKPVALKMVWEVARAVDVPVIGIGGIRDVDDVIEFLLAGASAVQVGTANYLEPTIIPRILDALPARLEELGAQSVKELIGAVRPY